MHNRTTCGAKTRSGSPCKMPLGWGTDHVGEGRCKRHGGNAGAPIKHGRYSVKHRKSLAAKAEQFQADPLPHDLGAELALMRALFQDYLDRFSDGVPIPATDITMLMTMLESVARMVERIVKMLNQTALTQAEVEYIKTRMVHELPQYIPDARKQIAFVRAIFGAVST